MEDEEYKDTNPQRVMVFIDGNNLYHCLKEKGWATKTDIGFLVKRLVGNRTLQRIYYYNALPPGNTPRAEASNTYFDRVKKTPNLTFHLSRLQVIKKNDVYGTYQSYREKGGDTAMTTDMVVAAARDEFDTVIIVASDGDYEPAAKIMVECGKYVEVVYFSGRKPFVMESCALMRSFRPGYAVDYDSSPPPQILFKQNNERHSSKKPKKHWHKDYPPDDPEEDY